MGERYSMNSALETSLNQLERLLRWIYPGLLFWVALPFAFVSAKGDFSPQEYANFYDGEACSDRPV